MPQHEYVLFRCQCNSNGMYGCVGAYTGVYAATYESPHLAIMRTCISDIFSVRKFSVCTFRQLVFERNSHCLPCIFECDVCGTHRTIQRIGLLLEMTHFIQLAQLQKELNIWQLENGDFFVLYNFTIRFSFKYSLAHTFEMKHRVFPFLRLSWIMSFIQRFVCIWWCDNVYVERSVILTFIAKFSFPCGKIES